MAKRVISEALVRRGEEENKFDREFWAKQSYEDCWNAAWQMVVEVELIRGKDIGELRLQRSVECLKRRKR